MMSLKETKFSMRQCSLILLPVDVVSGSVRCSGCPEAFTPSGMLLAGTCNICISDTTHVSMTKQPTSNYCDNIHCNSMPPAAVTVAYATMGQWAVEVH